MKVIVAVHPNETHEVTLTQRDNVTGRDIASETLRPGDYYERKLEANTDFSIKLGARVADDPAPQDDDDAEQRPGGQTEVGASEPTGVEQTESPPANSDLGHQEPEPALQPAPAGITGAGVNPDTGEHLGSAVDANQGDDSKAGDDEEKVELRDAADSDVKDILVDLESQPSVERTGDGKVQVATINKALAAKGFKPITAAKRDELVAQ